MMHFKNDIALRRSVSEFLLLMLNSTDLALQRSTETFAAWNTRTQRTRPEEEKKFGERKFPEGCPWPLVAGVREGGTCVKKSVFPHRLSSAYLNNTLCL